MSAEELSKLSLGDTMVTTRARAARARTAPVQTQGSATSSESSSPVSDTLESATGLTYDLSILDEQVRKRAARGLKADDNAIKMKYCRELDSNEYYFYLYDDISVKMGGTVTPRCSCGANEGGKACKHLFWIIDKLATRMPSSIKEGTLHLAEDGSSLQSRSAEDGSSVRNLRPAEIIDRLSLESLSEHHEWFLLRESEEVEEELTEILSTFEPSAFLPSEFKEPGSPLTTEASQKFKEFADIIIQYATEDLGLLGRLREAVDPAFRAGVFFEKINHRITRAFDALDEYMARGSTHGHIEKFDIAVCATELERLVNAVEEFYHQHEDDEFGVGVSVRAAAALIIMLERVTDRDFNAYDNATWVPDRPKDPRENNLFFRLIVSPATERRLFALGALLGLPHDDVVRNHLEALRRISMKLERQGTPEVFKKELNTIVSESKKRAGSDAEGGSAKRSMQ